MRMTNPNMPRQPVTPRKRISAGSQALAALAGKGLSQQNEAQQGASQAYQDFQRQKAGPSAGSQALAARGMKKGGMATKNKDAAMKHGGMATKNKDAAMKHGGMAHDAKAKKGRGMAIMIAIGKPKGRGK